ncbi:MAG: DUF885 domain-containing protein, partial [Acidimicrobiia bacterium]
LSPDGHRAVADLYRRARAELASVEPSDRWERLAVRVLEMRLAEELAAHDHLDHLRHLNNIASPLQHLKETFDVMDRTTVQGWENVAERLRGLGGALAGYRRSLEEGKERGLAAAARQVRAVAEEAGVLAGERSQFAGYPAECLGTAPQLADGVAEAADSACGAAGELAAWLEAEYLPHAPEVEAVGEERYLRHARAFLGSALDARETYQWGWEEIGRLGAELERVAADIDPDRSVAGVVDLMKTDPARRAAGLDEFLKIIGDRQEQALAELDGVHFDVPEPIRLVTVNLSPPGGALGAYYLPPSEDFSRPGGIWYSCAMTEVPLYEEISTAYHEGFPGHHLQIGLGLTLADSLSRAHRLWVWYPGYGEGWALYAERLMGELGYFEKPDYLLGMLVSHIFRACRVVIDIGCHLGLPIPPHAPFEPGELWDFDRAVRMLEQVAFQPHDYAVSEVTRYLGWPGQAIAYKVGERAILDLRGELQRRQGSTFDLKEFHQRVLGSGPVGLDLLREQVLEG